MKLTWVRNRRRPLRLATDKFDMSYRVSAMTALAMNLLRLLDRHTLLGPQSPVLHAAQRRSIRTVMQKLMIKAVRHDVPRTPVGFGLETKWPCVCGVRAALALPRMGTACACRFLPHRLTTVDINHFGLELGRAKTRRRHIGVLR